MTPSPADTATLDLIDVTDYVTTGSDPAGCARLASCLTRFGAVLLHDTRVAPSDVHAFRALLERYFALSHAHKLLDARPALHYQVGATPPHIERPRRNADFVTALAPQHRPISAEDVAARRRDPKWRFFWRIGPRPRAEDTRFPQLNALPVVPAPFADEWSGVMDTFGGKMLAAVHAAAQMLAEGLGLKHNEITEKMQDGPHLLAPTGADLAQKELGETVGATLAGYHYDLNLLTIHAAASFPGLHIWTRSGERLRVLCPPGALLLQAGVQLEHLTGGAIMRGFHEVVVTEETVAAARAAIEAGRSAWRVSSTFFAHVRSDASLRPLGRFAQLESADKYDMLAGDQVAEELRAIALAEE